MKNRLLPLVALVAVGSAWAAGAKVELTPYCPSAPVRLQAGENRIELCYRPGKNGKTWYAFALTHPKGDPRFEFLELSDVGQG